MAPDMFTKNSPRGIALIILNHDPCQSKPYQLMACVWQMGLPHPNHLDQIKDMSSFMNRDEDILGYLIVFMGAIRVLSCMISKYVKHSQ